jgi:hypothetical protein
MADMRKYPTECSGYRFKNLQFYAAGSAARAEARRLDGSPSTWCCDLLVGQVEKLSPPHRGMTWKCRWGTDCSELGPLALRMLTPSAPRAERIASATRLTSAIDWARTCGAASKTSVTCAVGTTRVWPGAIGVSGAKAHVDGPRAIHMAVSSRMRRQKTQSMVPDVLRSRPAETRFSVATKAISNARKSARTSQGTICAANPPVTVSCGIALARIEERAKRWFC